MRTRAHQLGFDLSVLKNVTQQGCTYPTGASIGATTATASSADGVDTETIQPSVNGPTTTDLLNTVAVGDAVAPTSSVAAGTDIPVVGPVAEAPVVTTDVAAAAAYLPATAGVQEVEAP